jgi:hypothetical protein
MDAVQPGQLRQLILRDALSTANGFDLSADDFLNVLQRLQPRACIKGLDRNSSKDSAFSLIVLEP